MEQPLRNPNLVFCNKCGMANQSTNKFCYGCGGSLFTVTCSYCSTVNPHFAKFCGSCGRSLSPGGS